MRASVGRIVHYVSRGSADGYFPPVCRAAVITEVRGPEDVEDLGLCVLNPSGMFFDSDVSHDESCEPGTWHWPERVE